MMIPSEDDGTRMRWREWTALSGPESFADPDPALRAGLIETGPSGRTLPKRYQSSPSTLLNHLQLDFLLLAVSLRTRIATAGMLLLASSWRGDNSRSLWQAMLIGGVAGWGAAIGTDRRLQRRRTSGPRRGLRGTLFHGTGAHPHCDDGQLARC